MRYVKSAIIGLLGTVALATSASAAIVCNDEGDCWRVKEKHTYPSGVNVQIYDDDWTWGDRPNYRWRDAGPKRGYWSRGVWIDF
jgi:hypothetical protein